MATPKDDKTDAEKKPAAAPKKKASTAAASKAKPAAASKPAASKTSSDTKKAPASKAAPAKAAAAKPAATVAKATPAKTTPTKKPAASKSPVAPSPSPSPVVAASSAAESFTAEEKKRLVKLQSTMELLSKDAEWTDFLDEQKLALYQLRDELVPNMQSVTRDHLRSGASNVSSASGQHMGDAGSEAEVRDLTIRLLDKDREQLFEIDAALERIRRGTYGICEESLEPIPKGRLRVRPFCRLTVKCQEEFEKKYGIASTYSSSNSEIIGYAGLQNIQESAISLDEDSE